ncbi:MAG: nucleoside-diphosphate kinase [Treponemataceae bacterium]|nr:nucleoside-diphosphate kinase [Treponemataceae bacterium]
MLKPGVLSRRLAGEIISRFEKKGLKLVGMKLMQISDELASKHYEEHKGKSFYDELVSYITSAPVLAMVWQAENTDICCAQIVRKMVGPTKLADSIPGTIRGDYGLHTNLNVIHASDSNESAEREVKLFFNENELFDWQDNNSNWI